MSATAEDQLNVFHLARESKLGCVILGESVVGATSVAYLSGTKDRSCCQQHPMHETMMVDLCI